MSGNPHLGMHVGEPSRCLLGQLQASGPVLVQFPPEARLQTPRHCQSADDIMCGAQTYSERFTQESCTSRNNELVNEHTSLQSRVTPDANLLFKAAACTILLGILDGLHPRLIPRKACTIVLGIRQGWKSCRACTPADRSSLRITAQADRG